MRTSIRIIWTLGLLISYMTTLHAQLSDNNLNRIWELNSVEPLNGMGGLGDEMKRLDMRSEAQMVFEEGGQSVTISYKIIDQEIRLFDEDGNHLGPDIIFQIERLTTDELILLLIAREKNQKLARLNYRAKD